MKLNTILLIFLYLLLIVFAGYYFYSKPKTGYVVLTEVYADFQLKKELESKLKSSQSARQRTLDSMAVELNSLSEALREKEAQHLIEEFEIKRRQYLTIQQQIEEVNQAQVDQYDNQIWQQLNQYIQDYGKENNYDFIYGADGSGTLMYSAEEHNLTGELKEYINNKYIGK